MDIDQIIYALEVHNSGSISKAAQNLFIAQPNLSSAIKKLEDELDIVIFSRTNVGTTTTEEGLEFMQYARSVVTRYNAMLKRYSKAGEESYVSISSMRSSLIIHRLCAYINVCLADEKKVNFRLKEASNIEVLNDVINNVADIGILRANVDNFDYYSQIIETNQLFEIPLLSDSYVLLMSKSHPLADQKQIAPEELYPFTEVYYGDFELSWYPSMSKMHSVSNEVISSNLVQVYDRATFLDAISKIDGAYSFTTTSTYEVLSKYGLIEKEYPGHIMESKECVIMKQSSLHKRNISILLSVLNAGV